MPRLLPLAAIAFFLYFWFRSRRQASATPGDTAPPMSRLSTRSQELGFVPEERLDTELAAPRAPELDRALAGVAAGDWRPAADLLTATGEDWERRSMYVNALGTRAAEDDSWLVDWEAARPDDPDAAVVRADSTVALAWELRGGAFAKDTSREQFEGFHRTLARSRQEIDRALALNPQDPTPYIKSIWMSLGLGRSHEEMREVWSEVTARAPHHYEAHYAALQYWCRKWRGSNELARDFASGAAAVAPPGALLSALPLIAWFEAYGVDDAKASDFRTPAMRALVDAAEVDAAAAPEDHPRLAEVHHLLAFFLHRQGRHAEALEYFRRVDGYIGALPWRYYRPRFYLAAREATVRKAG